MVEQVLVQAEQGVAVAWAQNLRVAYRGYQIHSVFCGNPRIAPEGNQQLWQLATAEGHRYGGWQQSYAEAAAEIDDTIQQEEQHAGSAWYAGSEWRSDVQTTHTRADGVKVYGELHDCDCGEAFRWDNTAGPGSAKDAAYAYYNALCRERGASGMCWIGRLEPAADAGQPDVEHEEETVERDPGQEEEDRQAAYEEYLERNHDAIVQQERYEAFRAEC